MSVVLLKSSQNVQYLPKICRISVRWATKPRWVPTAKTKIFKVPPGYNLPKEEDAQSKILFKHYYTYMKSTLNLLRMLYKSQATADEVVAKFDKEKEDAWQEALKLNDEWNRQVAVEREQRDREAFEKEVEKALAKMEEVNENRRLQQEEVEAMIRKQKELSKTFITAENIDAHIEKILTSPPTDFNYAIDLHGNIYDGLSKIPTRSVYDTIPEEKQEIVENTG